MRFCLFGEILRAVQVGALPRAEAYAPVRSPYSAITSLPGMMTERPVAGEPCTPGPVLVPRSSHSCATWPGAISRILTRSTVMSGQSGPDRFGPVADGLQTRVGITVSAPFGEELDNHVGVPTVPGFVVASIEFLQWSLCSP
jgi:hypothetical protein